MKKSIGEGKDYLLDLLVSLGFVTAEQVAAAREAANDCGVGVVNWMLVHRILRPDDISQTLAAQFDTQFVKLRAMRIGKKIIATVPGDIARKYRVIPVSKGDNALTIAIADPSDLVTVDSVGHLLNAEITPLVASEEDIEAAIKKYYPPKRRRK